ncbi:PPOX class F420-dependent oxidoreductase [Cellulomonas endometrii]|uniref:PPOX class F420-dependent oxidoreductase n=1 Tax=Cellulomonas endometrii TaxID=3036301 RepID=UPI0024ACF4A8|nr:PPOX class F420-dependent oxidoreductase [Cellulomonas endometrii]
MPTSTLPAGHADLLERPLFAHLATVRPDGSPQSSVMWFVWDGEVLRFTHTSTRQKFRNIQHEPRVALSVADPDDEYRYLEIRGTVESVEQDDAEASFYRSLQVLSERVDANRRPGCESMRSSCSDTALVRVECESGRPLVGPEAAARREITAASAPPRHRTRTSG